MIHLTSDNYKQYLPLEVVAFDLAYPGAQGEPGAINIYTRKGEQLHLNYAWEPWTEQQLDELLPLRKQIQWGPFGANTPKGYEEIYMGGGNILVIRSEYKDRLQCAWKKATEQDPKIQILYQVRDKLILQLIEEDSAQSAN